MRKFEGSIDGVDLFHLGRNADDFSVEDLVVENRRTAVYVYYLISEFPRYRVSCVDDWEIDESGAVVAYSDVVNWEETTEIIDRAYFLFAHDFESFDDLRAWEAEFISKAFIAAHDCDFVVRYEN